MSLTPTIPDSVVPMIWAGFVIVAAITLLAGYRKWQSESAYLVLSSQEYKARETALVEGLKQAISSESHNTRELLGAKLDSLGRSLDDVKARAATKEDLADIRGKVRALQDLNTVFHGVPSRTPQVDA